MSNTPKTIAFIGAGNMARALITGLIQTDFPADHIWVSSPDVKNRGYAQIHPKIHVTSNNAEAAKHANIIVIAVKPGNVKKVCEEIKKIIPEKFPMIVSIATGIKIESIQQWLGSTECNIVRAMPNIAAAVTASATGLYAKSCVTTEQKNWAEGLFRSVGSTIWLESELQLDAITAISGSGPAYLFYVFEAMQAAAMALNIPENIAKWLVSETAISAATMASESDDTFHELREFVTSPKGTTRAALDVLDRYQVQGIFKDAIEAAFLRAKELTKENS